MRQGLPYLLHCLHKGGGLAPLRGPRAGEKENVTIDIAIGRREAGEGPAECNSRMDIPRPHKEQERYREHLSEDMLKYTAQTWQ